MSLFLYRRQKTPLHLLDPRVKIITLILSFTAAAASSTLYSSAAVLMALAVLFVVSKSYYSIFKMGGLLFLIGFMTYILWVLFYEGKTQVVDLKVLKIYRESFSYASLMTIKFLNMLLCGILFLSITSLEEFSDGLLLLGVPYGVSFAVSLSFRLVLIFVSTGFTIVEAQKVRGNDTEKGGFFTRIRSFAPLLIPLILNGIKKAETLSLALESKGFSPGHKIDIKGKYSFKMTDTIAVILAAAASAAVIISGAA